MLNYETFFWNRITIIIVVVVVTSPGLVVAFYGVFYLSLLVYFGILIGILTAILDEIHPWRQGMDSPLKFTPGNY
jgi:hypothetical protein